jgi:uncharacterized repeat protein (TIGR01451 family)
MGRARHIVLGLALGAGPALAQVPPAGQGPYLPHPAPPQPAPNPVPPQFRGQPVNPPGAGGGSGLMPAAGSFRPVAAPPEKLPGALGAPGMLTTSARAPAAAPTVLVEKRGPETVNAGSPLAYEIVVRNLGQSAVANVRVEDELPPGTRLVGSDPPAEAGTDRVQWALGVLDAGAERKLRVEVQPGQDGEFHSTATVTFSTTAALSARVVRPKLAVTMTGPAQATAGDSVPLAIRVSNPGTGPVQSLVLRVKLPAGLQHPNGHHIEADLGPLPAGDSRDVPLKVTAAAGGPQLAEVTASGEAGLEAHARAPVNVAQPLLQLRRSGPSKVLFKGEVVEEWEIANPGNAPTGEVRVTEVLPVGMEFVGATDGAQYDPVGRSVSWKLGPQAPGTARKVVLKAKAAAVGEQTTRAMASAERGLEARAEGTVAVEGIPALALELVDLEDPVEVGGELTYEVRVVNQGSCPCTNIRITAEAPEGLLPAEATGPVSHAISGSQVVFEPLPRLATKADVVYRIKVRGTQAGDYRFKVQMTCDQSRLPVTKEEGSRVYK